MSSSFARRPSGSLAAANSARSWWAKLNRPGPPAVSGRPRACSSARTSTMPNRLPGVAGRVVRLAVAERTLAPAPPLFEGGAVRRAVTSFHRSLGGLVRPPFFADLGRGGRGRGGTEAGAAAAAVAVAAVAMAAAVGSSRERLFARPSDICQAYVSSVPGEQHWNGRSIGVSSGQKKSNNNNNNKKRQG